MSDNDDLSIGSMMKPPNEALIAQWEQQLANQEQTDATAETSKKKTAGRSTGEAKTVSGVQDAAFDTVQSAAASKGEVRGAAALPPAWMTSGGIPPPAHINTPLIKQSEGIIWFATSSLVIISIALTLMAKLGTKSAQLDMKLLQNSIKSSLDISKAKAKNIMSAAWAEHDSLMAQAMIGIIKVVTQGCQLGMSIGASLSTSRANKKANEEHETNLKQYLPYKHTEPPSHLQGPEKVAWKAQLGQPGKNIRTGKPKEQHEIDAEIEYANVRANIKSKEKKDRTIEDNEALELQDRKMAEYLPTSIEHKALSELTPAERKLWEKDLGKPGSVNPLTKNKKTEDEIKAEESYRTFRANRATSEMQEKQLRMTNVNLGAGMATGLADAAELIIKAQYAVIKARFEAQNAILDGYEKQLGISTNSTSKAYEEDQEAAKKAMEVLSNVFRNQQKWGPA